MALLIMNKEKLAEYFEFLDDFADGSLADLPVNRYIIKSFLKKMFNTSQEETEQIVSLWFDTICKGTSVIERANLALRINPDEN